MSEPTASTPVYTVDPYVDDAGATDDEPFIVLPWWQRPTNIFTLLVTVALVAAMVGWLVEDATSQNDTSEVDIGFLQDMRVHHEQAVDMSFIYLQLPDTSAGLSTDASGIVVGQSQEIGRMIQLLRDAGAPEAALLDGPAMVWMGDEMSTSYDEMPGMASKGQLDQLRTASGNQADELFVRLMTEHHQGGIEMAEFAADNGSNGEVTRFATAIARSQRTEIVELERLD